MTTFLMICLLVLIGLIYILGIRFYRKNRESFFCVQDSRVLKGFWSIVVLMVHIPVEYSNTIQDMIGSFAYIGVTFFFMMSSFGIRLKSQVNDEYLKLFLKRKFISIIIPFLFATLIVLILYTCHVEMDYLMIYKVYKWVILLVFLNLFQYAIYMLPDSIFIWRGKYIRDTIVCFSILILSIIAKFSSFGSVIGWHTEMLGYVYGIIFSYNIERVKKWATKKWCFKTIIMCIAAVILGCGYLRYKTVFIWGDYVLRMLLDIAIISFVLLCILRIEFNNKIIGWFGKISYWFYLTHIIVIQCIMASGILKGSGAYIWCVLFVSVSFSSVLYCIYKKILGEIR